MRKQPIPLEIEATADASTPDSNSGGRALANRFPRPAEIVRILRACEHAGKQVNRMCFTHDGGVIVVFNESNTSAAAQQLDLVTMAIKHG